MSWVNVRVSAHLSHIVDALQSIGLLALEASRNLRKSQHHHNVVFTFGLAESPQTTFHTNKVAVHHDGTFVGNIEVN